MIKVKDGKILIQGTDKELEADFMLVCHVMYHKYFMEISPQDATTAMASVVANSINLFKEAK